MQIFDISQTLRARAKITWHFVAAPGVTLTFCLTHAIGSEISSGSTNRGAATLRGAAASGHLLRCRSSTMSPHRLRRGALHLPTRRSRQNANLFLREPLEGYLISRGGRPSYATGMRMRIGFSRVYSSITCAVSPATRPIMKISLAIGGRKPRS